MTSIVFFRVVAGRSETLHQLGQLRLDLIWPGTLQSAADLLKKQLPPTLAQSEDMDRIPITLANLRERRGGFGGVSLPRRRADKTPACGLEVTRRFGARHRSGS